MTDRKLSSAIADECVRFLRTLKDYNLSKEETLNVVLTISIALTDEILRDVIGNNPKRQMDFINNRVSDLQFNPSYLNNNTLN